jgi:hypothetical protein
MADFEVDSSNAGMESFFSEPRLLQNFSFEETSSARPTALDLIGEKVQ